MAISTPTSGNNLFKCYLLTTQVDTLSQAWIGMATGESFRNGMASDLSGAGTEVGKLVQVDLCLFRMELYN